MITDIKITDKMLVIAPAITIWSARRKMQAEDFGDSKDALPPDDIASLGVKKLCPPEKLRPFAMLKSRATSLLARHGIPFLPGAWLVPADKASELNKALEEIKADFDREKESFLNDYTRITSDWVMAHPDFAEMLVKSMASPDYVRSRLSFGWRAFALRMTRNSNIRDELENLGNSVFIDIAKEAAVVKREVFADRDSVTQKALNPIRALAEKLRGLSFIHPQVLAATSLVQSCLERMPAKGEISGSHLGEVLALLSLLTNPVALEDATSRMVQHNAAPETFIIPAPVPTATKPAPIAAMPPKRSMIRNVGLW